MFVFCFISTYFCFISSYFCFISTYFCFISSYFCLISTWFASYPHVFASYPPRTQHLLSAVAPRRSLLPAPAGPRHLQPLRGSRLEYRVKPTHTPTQGTRNKSDLPGWIRYPAHTKNNAITSSRIVDVDKRKCRAQFPPVETTTFGVCVLNYLTPDEPALNIHIFASYPPIFALYPPIFALYPPIFASYPTIFTSYPPGLPPIHMVCFISTYSCFVSTYFCLTSTYFCFISKCFCITNP
jgi:hypothetical protein